MRAEHGRASPCGCPGYQLRAASCGRVVRACSGRWTLSLRGTAFWQNTGCAGVGAPPMGHFSGGARVPQMDPEGDELASHLHITPCRASRALALRFLALKWEQTMGDMTIVSLPARVTRQAEDKIRVTGHTSDLSELISGLSKARASRLCRWRAEQQHAPAARRGPTEPARPHRDAAGVAQLLLGSPALLCISTTDLAVAAWRRHQRCVRAQVYIVEPADSRAPRKSMAIDSSLMDRLAVKVVPSLFDGRVEFLDQAAQLTEALHQLKA